MSCFISSIVAPILSLDAKFVMAPEEREKAPLRKLKPALAASGLPRVDANNNVIETNARKYEDTLRHSLLHETFHAIGKDYDERDEKLANIELHVVMKRWEFECRVPTEIIINLSQKMQGRRGGGRGRKRGKKQMADDAEFFIKEWTVGIARGGGNGKPVLAIIKGCRKYVICCLQSDYLSKYN